MIDLTLKIAGDDHRRQRIEFTDGATRLQLARAVWGKLDRPTVIAVEIYDDDDESA